MAYFAAQIANDFIRRGVEDGVNVDPLKIQKLVYLAHGWHLAFVAWKYGPVVPDLYREFRGLGNSSIKEQVCIPVGAPFLDERTKSLLAQVWQKYGRISGIELSALTHQQGYAWEMARRGNSGGWNSPDIPNDWIKDEFQRRLAKG